jgi:hypothetical protein
MKRLLFFVLAVAALVLAPGARADAAVRAGSAATFTTGPLVQISASSPFAGCTRDNVSAQSGTNFPNSEVEPWVDVDPLDASEDRFAIVSDEPHVKVAWRVSG